MRAVLVLAAVLLLGGCTEADWSYVIPPAPQSVRLADAPSAAAAVNYSAYMAAPSGAQPGAAEKCARAARDRRGDGEAQGFDDALLKAVYDQTYSDCMDWATRGRAR